MNVLQKNPVFLNKFRRRHGWQFQQPCQRIFVKMQKKSPRVRRKWKNYKTPEKTEFSTNDPLNLLNAVLRAVAKLYKQKFDVFSLISELKAERVPVSPLKSFLWTRSRQFWKPHGKTIDKSPKKKNVVNFTKSKGSLLTFSAHTLNAALTNFTEVFLAKVLKTIAERPKLTNNKMLLKKIDTLEKFLQTYREQFSQTCW